MGSKEMKKILHVLGAVALLVAMYFLLQLLFIVVAEIVAVGAGVVIGDVPREAIHMIDNALYLKENPVTAAYVVKGQAWGMLLSTISMLLFLHFTGYYRLRKGLLHSIAPRPLLISTLLVFTSMFALNIFVQWFSLKDNLSDIFSGLSRNVVGIASLAFFGPLLEEVLFRGAIQGLFMRYFGRPWPAILLSALVFGVFHMNPVQIVYATLLGIVFGWIYYRTGSLLSVIVGHVLNNSFAVTTTVLYGAEQEQAVADSAAGIAGFALFAVLSVYLAVRLNKEMVVKSEN